MNTSINESLSKLNNIYRDKKEAFIFYIRRISESSNVNEYAKAFEKIHLNEISLLESIKNEFKNANKKVKSFENIINIHTYEFKKDAMAEYLNSEEDQNINVEEDLKKTSRLLSKEKYKLKNAISKLSEEERVVLSSIRLNFLKTQINNSEIKINQYKNEIQNIQNLLKQIDSSLPKYKNLKAKYNLLRKSFLSEQQKNKLNIEEMQYWQVLAKMPSHSLERFYRLGA